MRILQSIQRSVKPLHTCAQPLHTFFHKRPYIGIFATLSTVREMKKQESERLKSLARTLFLAGREMAEIAQQTGVSRVTLSKWCKSEGWRESRAASAITRPELVNKLLLAIDALITQVSESNDPQLLAGLGDKLAKLSSVIEKLDKKANVVDAIEVFMAFSRWLEFRSQTDPQVTPELMRVINKYQDMYITEQMNIK